MPTRPDESHPVQGNVTTTKRWSFVALLVAVSLGGCGESAPPESGALIGTVGAESAARVDRASAFVITPHSTSERVVGAVYRQTADGLRFTAAVETGTYVEAASIASCVRFELPERLRGTPLAHPAAAGSDGGARCRKVRLVSHAAARTAIDHGVFHDLFPDDVAPGASDYGRE
jgi:hypothetical protein